MGIALYRRPRDGVVFAIISPKEGPRDGICGSDPTGGWRRRADGSLRASFGGRFSATTLREENEIEAVAVDDSLGYVYYADEADGIHKWHADPHHPDAASELAHFGRSGYRGDREGIAIYALDDGSGYIVCTDQLDDNSEYHLYPREGKPDARNYHT